MSNEGRQHRASITPEMATFQSPLRELHPGIFEEKRVWKFQALNLDEVLQDSPKCHEQMRKIEEVRELDVL